jgi:hypothetical protein
MPDFKAHLESFFNSVAKDEIEIYNEFSLQHEFGVYLHALLGSVYRVQFERPVDFFDLARSNFVKKEIDISVFTPDLCVKYAVELKYPRNGQHPEQMFKACQDICFLEQLLHGGFKRCYFVMVADDPLFYEHSNHEGIYKHFRANSPIHGHIQKPTGMKNDAVDISGSYSVNWNMVSKKRKYAVVEIA